MNAGEWYGSDLLRVDGWSLCVWGGPDPNIMAISDRNKFGVQIQLTPDEIDRLVGFLNTARDDCVFNFGGGKSAANCEED
jgi:hypothetical protein